MGHAVAEVTNEDQNHEALTELSLWSLHRVKKKGCHLNPLQALWGIQFALSQAIFITFFPWRRNNDSATYICVMFYAWNTQMQVSFLLSVCTATYPGMWQSSQCLMISRSYTFSTTTHGRGQRRGHERQHDWFSPVQYHTHSLLYLQKITYMTNICNTANIEEHRIYKVLSLLLNIHNADVSH